MSSARRPSQRLGAPRIPVDRVVRVLEQVRARLGREPVGVALHRRPIVQSVIHVPVRRPVSTRAAARQAGSSRRLARRARRRIQRRLPTAPAHAYERRRGRHPGESVDLIFLAADSLAELALLADLRLRIVTNGAIWIVSRKGKQATIRDTDVIAATLEAGLVDNKVVSFSDDAHARLRAVIRLRDRALGSPADLTPPLDGGDSPSWTTAILSPADAPGPDELRGQGVPDADQARLVHRGAGRAPVGPAAAAHLRRPRQPGPEGARRRAAGHRRQVRGDSAGARDRAAARVAPRRARRAWSATRS